VQPRPPVKNVGLGTRVYLEGAMTGGRRRSHHRLQLVGDGSLRNPGVSVRDATKRVPSFIPMAEGLYTVDWRVTAVTANGGDGAPNDSGSFWVTSASW